LSISVSILRYLEFLTKMKKLKVINKNKKIVPNKVELYKIINSFPIIVPIAKCKHKVIVKAITIDEEQALHNFPALPN
jgi:hypothetical protein